MNVYLCVSHVHNSECVTLGLFYYTLGNLDPILRSFLQNIHLCVAKCEVKKYGIEEILKPILESIKEGTGKANSALDFSYRVYLVPIIQEEGVMFEFDGRQVSFRGTLTVVSADNLAAWSLGGFKVLASAFHKCQYCMVTMEEMQTQV